MDDIQKKICIDKEKKQTNEKPNKLCAHTITRQARTTSTNRPTILSMIIWLPIILIKMNEKKVCKKGYISNVS